MLSSQDSMFSYDPSPAMVCRQWRPDVERAPRCPRCDSTNTKFCYYNNYSLSQPRYFCKGCRRYWTKGGSLRNVPVGGGFRKSRRRRGRPSDGKLTDSIPAAVNDPRPAAAGANVLPDLALDGAVQTMNSELSTEPIDIADLYVKYLIQSPALSETQVVVPDFAGEVGSSSNYQSPLEHEKQARSLGEEFLMSSHREEYYQQDFKDLLNPFVEPPEIQMETNFFPSGCDLDVPRMMSEDIRYRDFESLIPSFDTPLQGQNFTYGDHEWSTLDYSSLETFYRP